MERAINLIKHVITLLRITYSHTNQIGIEHLEMALESLEHPRWETPKQYRERTGEELPEDAPVWTRNTYRKEIGLWHLETYEESKGNREVSEEYGYQCDTIIATVAGLPPDDWRPE